MALEIRKFVFNPFGVSTYVVWDPTSKDGIAVDPGMSNPSEQRLFDNFVADNGIRLRQVVNTHLHLDHCWGNNYVTDRYGVKVAASVADDFLGERAAQQALMFGIPGDGFSPVYIDVPLKNGDVIHVGDGELQVLEVPGHSPGGIALYDAADGWVIVGDALFAGAIGRTDLPGGDYGQLIHNIRTRLLTLPGNTIVYPGHEAATTIAREKSSNPYLR